jgi:hypothetical protein
MKLGTGSGLVQRPSVNRGEKGATKGSGTQEETRTAATILATVARMCRRCWSRFAESIVLGERSHGGGQEGLGKEQLE